MKFIRRHDLTPHMRIEIVKFALQVQGIYGHIIPWDHLLVASVRVILRGYGITSGSLVIDNTDHARSKSANQLAYLYNLRDKENGDYVWGQSLVFLLLATPTISMPVGFVFYQPDSELSA